MIDFHDSFHALNSFAHKKVHGLFVFVQTMTIIMMMGLVDVSRFGLKFESINHYYKLFSCIEIDEFFNRLTTDLISP